MRFRKLRIAWSVGCGLACVLLIALWVRSYWLIDTVGNARNTPPDITITSLVFDQGHFRFYRMTQPMKLNPSRTFPDGWGHQTIKATRGLENRFLWINNRNQFGFQFPLLLPLILLVGIGLFPWRQSLMGLPRPHLIAGMLIAVGLGLMIYAVT